MKRRSYGFGEYGYIPHPRKKGLPMWCYHLILVISVTVLILEVSTLAIDISTDPNINRGIVIEKIGQNKPVITWPVSEYGWIAGNEIQDPEGWFVLVHDGFRYQRFRLSKEQFDKVDVNAKIWRFGPWTFWKNRS